MRTSILVRDADGCAFGIVSARRLLEPEGPRLMRPSRDRVEIAVKQHAVDHRVADAGRIVDVVERVLVEDNEVGQLSRLDRAEIMVMGSHGYETVAKGTNGFVCMVQRAWANNFDAPPDVVNQAADAIIVRLAGFRR